MTDREPLKDLERWGAPGEHWVQTVRSTSKELPGWMVFDSAGPCRLKRSTEDEVLTWLNEQGLTRQRVGPPDAPAGAPAAPDAARMGLRPRPA